MNLVRKLAIFVAVAVLLGGVALGGLRQHQSAAQDATPSSLAGHPLVGSWIVDTDTSVATDSPEIGIFTSDGTVLGMGATRWVAGSWEAADDTTGAVTMAGVFAANGGGYVVLRGDHVVDSTGDAWTCECTFTVVGPNGETVASGTATAHATRLPIESVDAAGMPLVGFPTWTPASADATPTT